MEATEVAKLAELEDRHWWYRERRALLARSLRSLPAPGKALDIGAAGGGNTRVLRACGWHAVAVEYGDTGAEICAGRGLDVVRGDATRLPFRSGSVDLVVAFDIIEHIEDDGRAVREMRRVLADGGHLLIAVPADPKLWSAHDEAVDHVRRYTREELRSVVGENGFRITDVRSWNVLLRPAAKARRRKSTGSDLEHVSRPVNATLGAIVRTERYLPVHRLPGVSLLLTAEAR